MMTMGNLLEEERQSGFTVTGEGDWSRVCSAALMLPEIDAAGLDVCMDDGRPTILVYAECTREEWENGVAAIRALAGHFGFTLTGQAKWRAAALGDSDQPACSPVAGCGAAARPFSPDCLFSAA